MSDAITQKPVIVGHRGFRKKFPENTLLSFNATISDAQCQIIETDLQLSKDGIILINHDAETGRTYNKNYKIQETFYENELSLLRNLEEPHEPILTFEKLIIWFSKKNGDFRNIKLMLDIKRVNNVIILDKIIETLIKVNNDLNYWYNKIIFGLWTPDFYDYAVSKQLLNNFEIVNITASITIAKIFLEKSLKYESEFNSTNHHKDDYFKMKISAISLLHIATWSGDAFIGFYDDLLEKNVRLYLWTVNSEEDIQFCCRLGVDGIVTDNPDYAQALVTHPNNDILFKRDKNLGNFYKKENLFNLMTLTGWRRYGLYTVYKGFEAALLRGYLSINVPIINGGKETIGSYSVSILKLLGII
ncbi:hypothetical protein PACTADRAFT_4556 [Pachysolen tannophilus NRRL Y-2460]|uniref:GP-PDE domain-containing protein n=1 Tax=Pachysolen tannophilus NRRL Y-2460 TaxID=669874 RepID=A0A1E4TPG7_PACTA|nr:hypothetical protein PACTADRAFT_4556 [Pachysolen tannophilus NRRL Y-2460]